MHVVKEAQLLQGSQGDAVWAAGSVPVNEAGARYPDGDHRTSDRRVFACQVAGVHQWPKALSDSRFDLGSSLLLRAEQGGVSYGGYEVGIWDARGTVQVGYVPTTLGGTIAGLMRSGTELRGEVIREIRLGSPTGRRLALHVLIAPPGPIGHVVHEQAHASEEGRSAG